MELLINEARQTANPEKIVVKVFDYFPEYMSNFGSLSSPGRCVILSAEGAPYTHAHSICKT